MVGAWRRIARQNLTRRILAATKVSDEVRVWLRDGGKTPGRCG
jgi:hypothetical protein